MSTSAAGLLRSLVLPALATLVCAQSPCGPQGLTLSWGGTTRLGDAYSIDLFGNSSVTGLIGADLLPGPVQTPLGLVCLGLGPSLLTIPFTLNAQGTFSLGGILPTSPSFYGVGAYLQAGAVDATQPGGFALSNGIHPVLRPPRLWVLQGSGSPGAVCIWDTITDTPSPAIPLPSSVIDAAALPQLGWLALLLAPPWPTAQPRLLLIDETGATRLDVTLLASAAPAALVVDGMTAYVLFSAATGGAVQSFALPSGTPGNTVPLGFNPGTSLAAYPGTGVVFVRSGFDVVPVDMANAVVVAPITLGAAPGTIAFTGWLYRSGVLYCLLSGTGLFGLQTPSQLNAIDVAALAPLHPATVLMPVPGGASRLSWATGPAGPSLYTTNGTTLYQVSPSTLQALPVAPLSVANASGLQSAGGSELLLYGNAGLFSSDFQPLNLSTFTTLPFVPVGSLPLSGAVLPVASTTLRKVYLVKPSSAAGTQVQLAWHGTDPVTAVQGVATLPLSAGNVIAVVD
jgi:hypothetical protein